MEAAFLPLEEREALGDLIVEAWGDVIAGETDAPMLTALPDDEE